MNASLLPGTFRSGKHGNEGVEWVAKTTALLPKTSLCLQGEPCEVTAPGSPAGGCRQRISFSQENIGKRGKYHFPGLSQNDLQISSIFQLESEDLVKTPRLQQPTWQPLIYT